MSYFGKRFHLITHFLLSSTYHSCVVYPHTTITITHLNSNRHIISFDINLEYFSHHNCVDISKVYLVIHHFRFRDILSHPSLYNYNSETYFVYHHFSIQGYLRSPFFIIISLTSLKSNY